MRHVLLRRSCVASPTSARRARWLLSWTLTAVAVLFVSSFALAQPVRPLNPVIFLPGILGSKLCDGSTVVWGNVLNTVRRFPDLELPLDPAANRLKPCGVLDDVQVLGPLRAGIYNILFKTFADLGFKEGQNLFVFDYDWRQSTLDNAARLAAFVAEIRARHGIPPEQRFNVVAHSMGGMVARIFVLRHGGQRHVERLVTVATPHFGSLNAFDTLLSGWGGLARVNK